MARGNTVPKPAAQRVRRNKTPEEVSVTADDELRGPELPDGFDWGQRTREWWLVWRRSAQAQTFTATDWEFLAETAMLHAELWAGNGAVAAELRLRESKLGATREDRLRLHMDVDTDGAKPKPVKKAAVARYGKLRAVADAG